MGIRIDNLLKIALDREFPLVDTKVPQTYGIVEKSSRQFVLGLRGSEASDDGRKAMQLGSVQFSTAQHRTGQQCALCCVLICLSIAFGRRRPGAQQHLVGAARTISHKILMLSKLALEPCMLAIRIHASENRRNACIRSRERGEKTRGAPAKALKRIVLSF